MQSRDYNELIKSDLKYIWHPFTQMKDFETEKPLLIERGKGVYLWDSDGNRYIDGISSWWVNTLGHSNDELNKALYEQAKKIEHVIFARFTHTPAIELAERLVKLTPEALTKVFYSDNGSTAVEVALKMAYQYWAQTGKPKKSKFVALKNSYHGDTIGSVSVGGVDLYHKIYNPLLFDVFQAESPYCYRCPCECAPETCQAECCTSVEEIFTNHSEEIAAIIVEPLVQAAGGMIIYPAKYLKRLRELCDKFEILLIADEVAVGFGRTGKMFACEHAAISPDFMCLAKGITGGYMPLAVTMTTEKVFNAFYGDYDSNKTFYHGHSYTANPLAVSIAVEHLKIFERDNILGQINQKSEILKNELEKFKNLTVVGDIRQIGLIAAVEIVKDKNTKEKFDFDARIGDKICKEALKRGAILRPLGHILYFMPPYVISEEQIKELCNIAYDSIKDALP